MNCPFGCGQKIDLISRGLACEPGLTFRLHLKTLHLVRASLRQTELSLGRQPTSWFSLLVF